MGAMSVSIAWDSLAQRPKGSLWTQFYETRALGCIILMFSAFLKKDRTLDVALAGFKVEFFLSQLPNAGMLPRLAPC